MTFEKNKIGILGVGAIGSVLSYELLKKDKNELFYFSRTKKNYLKISSNDFQFEIKINVETTITNSPNLDWLIICLKEHQYSGARNWFWQLIHPKMDIAIVRNGLGLKESISHFTSQNNILECIIDCPTQLNENQYYEPLYLPIITTTEGPLAAKFESLFNKIEIRRTDDFKTASWKKLCESSSLGAILCLSGETCWIFKNETMRDLYEDILSESIQVAKADGAKIEGSYIDEMLNKLLTYPEKKGSSMLTDRLNDESIELGAKNGVISKLGKEYNIETPINDLIVKLLTYTNHRT